MLAGVTKVGSRRVIQWASGLMILQGLISKFGAVFIIIPEPIVGGIFCVMFGMICAFGVVKEKQNKEHIPLLKTLCIITLKIFTVF